MLSKRETLIIKAYPNRITIHCTDTKNGKHVSVEAIDIDHRSKGWGGIGYHGIVQPDGEWIDTRPLNERGYHVSKHNDGNIGIALAGSDKFTKRQFDVLLTKIENLSQVYSIPRWEVYTHAQYDTAIAQGKTCPNIPINHLLAFLLTENYDCIRQYICEEGL